MDINVAGHVRYLLQLLENDDVWKAFWHDLHYQVLEVADCGMELSAPDNVIWDYCQREHFVLVTANRNSVGPDSLGETIEQRNSPTSLPVLTLANLARIEADRSYAVRTGVQLLQYLVDIEELRGVGRLYMP
jgi:hypothetical protein